MYNRDAVSVLIKELVTETRTRSFQQNLKLSFYAPMSSRIDGDACGEVDKSKDDDWSFCFLDRKRFILLYLCSWKAVPRSMKIELRNTCICHHGLWYSIYFTSVFKAFLCECKETPGASQIQLVAYLQNLLE